MKKDNNTGINITILLSLFFTSVSLFVYQVVLTRIYSAVLSYHYVFLITSFAILGSGIGSIIAYLYKRKKEKISVSSENLPSIEMAPIKIVHNARDIVIGQIKKISIILALSYFIIFSILYVMPFTDNMIIYIVFGTISFIIGGFLFSILFTEFSLISGKLYFADLIGSGIGSIAVIYLLNNAGMFRSVLLISLIGESEVLKFIKKICIANCAFIMLLMQFQ